jgi:hypothetical protein
MHVEDACAEGATLCHSAYVFSMDYDTTAVDWAKVVCNLNAHYYNEMIKPSVMRGCVGIDESLFGRRVNP